MNYKHRAIFLGRLSASRLYSKAIAEDPRCARKVLSDKLAIFAKIGYGALVDLEGERMDEWLADQLAHSKVIGVPPELSTTCSDCSNGRIDSGTDPHICDGRDWQRDKEALENGGLCIRIIDDAYRIADRIARKWYKDAEFLEGRRIRFSPIAQSIEPKGDIFVSDLPHDFSDSAAIVPANATTTPPHKSSGEFLIILNICVDRVEVQSICQLLLIIHHELFCHAFQFFKDKNDWPDEYDPFAEGFMNVAALHALQGSEKNLEKGELEAFGCRDYSDLCNRLGGLFEARDATFLGQCSLLGREAFGDLKSLCSDIDSIRPADIAVAVAVRLNSASLNPSEKLNIITLLRRLHKKSFELSVGARDELVEIVAKLLESRNERSFVRDLRSLDFAWGNHSA